MHGSIVLVFIIAVAMCWLSCNWLGDLHQDFRINSNSLEIDSIKKQVGESARQIDALKANVLSLQHRLAAIERWMDRQGYGKSVGE